MMNRLFYYVQTDEGEIQLDVKAKVNQDHMYCIGLMVMIILILIPLGFLPFFRLDNNKKTDQQSESSKKT